MMTALAYAKKCCDMIISKFPEADLPPVGMFHYHAGVFLSGMERTYLLTQEEKYNQYIQRWIDRFVDADGNVQGVNAETLDDLEPCNLLFRYYDGGEQRYRKVIDHLAPLLMDWPCNTQGGFWHKYCWPNQMWLDGLYMAGPLAISYARLTGKREYIALIHKQMKLMWDNMYIKETGLLRHAWDESKEMDWADKKTGLSPESWGRAVGWYLVSLADMSEQLEGLDAAVSAEFAACAAELAQNLIRWQDEATGLWYQVVDKGDDPANWLETSCSCLFAYGIANLVRRGLLPKACAAAAQRAFEGVVSQKTEEREDGFYIKDICIGTGVSDYQYYIDRPRTENDLHGTGAFVLMCTEYMKMVATLA